MPRFFLLLPLLAAALLLHPPSGDAALRLDPKFQPDLRANGSVDVVLDQPDGKLIVAGNFTFIGGVPRLGVARFNADGTLDAGFNPRYATERHPAGYAITAAALQSDGKLLIAGSFPASPYAFYTRVYRLNPDGLADASFDPGEGGSSHYLGVAIHALAVQPDGKVAVGGFFDAYAGVACNGLTRLNPDGSVDAGFQPVVDVTQGQSTLCSLVADRDGKLLLGGYFGSIGGSPRHGVARLNADGSLDAGFVPGEVAGGNVQALALQSNGKLIVAGNYHTADVPYGYGVYRLDADGTLDQTFKIADVDAAYGTLRIVPQPDGKVVVAGEFTRVGGLSRKRVARLAADGTADPDFLSLVGNAIHALAVQPDGTLILGGAFQSTDGSESAGFVRVRPDGTVMAGSPSVPGNAGYVRSLTVQPDGKVLVGGSLTGLNGGAAAQVARVNLDGSTDAGFQPDIADDEGVFGITLQPDGKVLLDGSFNFVDGQSTDHLARLNADGTRDAGFHATPRLGEEVRAVLPRLDGKFLVAGTFYKRNGKEKRGHLFRFNADGSPDPTFQPTRALPVGSNHAALQDDGKVVVGGDILLNGVKTRVVVRLNPDGSQDPAFAAAALGAEDFLRALVVQSDGAVLIAGNVSSVNGTDRHGLARLHPDGTLDADYRPGAEEGDDLADNVGRMAALDGGKLFIEGLFRRVGGAARYHAAVLNADGSPDAAFNPDAGDGGEIIVAAQRGGKLYLGGGFRSIDGAPRSGFARLKGVR